MEKTVEEVFEDKLLVAQASLRFLDEESNMEETCAAVNTDLLGVYDLRRELTVVKDSLQEWERNLKLGELLLRRVAIASRCGAALGENVSSVRFPTRAAGITTVQPGHPDKPGNPKPSCDSKRPSAAVPASLAGVAPLTVDEFKSLPAYMKGRRLTYEAVNEAIVEFNEALRKKYSFLGRGFQSTDSMERKRRFKEMRAQENKETKGKFFVVSCDLKDTKSLKTEANRKIIFTVLRHVSRIFEIRGPGALVRFCVK